MSAKRKPLSATPVEPAKPIKKLPSAWALTRSSVGVIWRHKGLFGGIIAIYALLSLIVIRGFSSGVAMEELQAVLGSEAGRLVSGIAAYTWLLNSSANGPSQVAGVYQMVLLVIVSLALVWALRQVHAGDKAVRVRDAFYKGMYPLIPVALVLITVFIQLIPLLIGLSLLNLVAGQAAIAVKPIEITIGIIVCLALIVLGIYLFVSTVFSFYIAALPDMTPVRALRSSRQVAKGRRLAILRKLLWLPLFLLLAGLIIMLPFILLLTPAAPWVAFLLTIAMLPVIHSYLYSMYRELIA